MRVGRIWEGRNWSGRVSDWRDLPRQKQPPEGFDDLTPMLGPGIYILVNEGAVVHIAKAKSVLTTVTKHRELVGKSMPSWFPLKGIVFDEVFWKTSHPDRIDAEVESLRRIHMRQEETLEVA